MSKVSKYEQETIITYNAAEKQVSVYTADPNVMKKLDEMVEKYPDHYKTEKPTDSYSKSYIIESKKLISFRAPKILTEEQKEELRKRFDVVRKK